MEFDTMELEITDKRDNPLLKRTEIKFTIAHDSKSTPSTKDVREALSKTTNSPKERVVVDNMHSTFGRGETKGYAKVYKTKEDAMRVEKLSIRKSHGLMERKKEEKVEKKKDA